MRTETARIRLQAGRQNENAQQHQAPPGEQNPSDSPERVAVVVPVVDHWEIEKGAG